MVLRIRQVPGVLGTLLCSLAFASDSRPAAAKWEGPVLISPSGGTSRTTIYYGSWQCSAKFMNACQERCSSQGRKRMGCIWLADIKTDWTGRVAFVIPAKAGGRLAITHCCCDYPVATDRAERRSKWDRARAAFREAWGRDFGEWPKSAAGKPWEGHHIHDLAHGGDPTGSANVLPVPGEVHGTLNAAYPACYSGQGQWAAVGPERPYAD